MVAPTSYPLMVSVSGVRGIVGRSITPTVVAKFAGAFGAWLREQNGGARQRVVIGRDGRAGGHVLHHAAIAGLAATGCDVIDLGVATTPTIGVMVDETEAGGGMVVTASHNPQEWNGLKCLVADLAAPQGGVGASAPSKVQADRIIARYESACGADAERTGLQTWEGLGEVEINHDAGTAHVDRVMEALSQMETGARRGPSNIADAVTAAGFRILVDSVNGSGRLATPLLAERLGCSLSHVGNRDSGRFSHAPEPTRDNLAGVGDSVRESICAVGFCQDPDADRLALLDEQGHYIGEEYTLALAAEAILACRDQRGDRSDGSEATPVIVTNLSTSRMVDDVAARHGGRVVRTAVGEANVVEAMKREAAAGRRVVLGGEGNGGVIWPAVTFVRDSLGAMGLVLGLMARTGQPLSRLVKEVPAYWIEKRKIELGIRTEADRATERVAGAFQGEQIDRQDGVRIDFEGRRSWLHVRASNTEPIMRLIAEAPTQREATELLDRAAALIA